MVSVARKGHLSWGEKRDFKKLVERAFSEACEGAVHLHSIRRTWITHQLKAAQIFFTVILCKKYPCYIHFTVVFAIRAAELRNEESPEHLPHNAHMLFALLSLSRFEIEWAVTHSGEVLPKGLTLSWAKTGFSVSQPLKMGFPDPQLMVLISHHTKLALLLQQYATSLKAHTAWLLLSLVTSTVQPMCEKTQSDCLPGQLTAQVATAPTLTKHHQPVIQTIEKFVEGYTRISKPDSRCVCCAAARYLSAPTANDELQSLSSVRDIWLALNMKLFSVKTNVTGQSLDALSSGSRASESTTAVKKSNE
eukprot:scaffold212331_cov45-Prasinocladus_malaysianus.AAC.1